MKDVLEPVKIVVYAEIKSRLMHVADVSPDVLENHAEMAWRRIEEAILGVAK